MKQKKTLTSYNRTLTFPKMTLPWCGLLGVFQLSFLLSLSIPGHLSGQVDYLYTDFGGFWQTGDLPRPDLENNLLAFRDGGTVYSTGVNDALLSSNSVVFSAQNFRAFPLGSIAVSSGYFISLGAAIDGISSGTDNSSTSPFPAFPDGPTLASFLTRGAKGLDLGSGIANSPSGSTFEFAIAPGGVTLAAIGDGVPDIFVSQIASSSPSNFDQLFFEDASGNLIGNVVFIDMSAVGPAGEYRADFYEPNSTGSSFVDENREIRGLTIDLIDFGLNAGNIGGIERMVYEPGGTSDPAFLAFNEPSLAIATSLAITGISPDQYKCNTPISPDFNIQVTDGSGNPVSQSGIAVVASVSLGIGETSAVDTVFTDASGIAQFSDLRVINNDGSIRITFSSASLDPVTSGTLTELPSVDPDKPDVNLSSEVFCPGDPAITISINGDLNDGEEWVLYTDGCGTNEVDRTAGNSLSVTPTETTTYYLRGEGDCVDPGLCDTFTIVYNTLMLSGTPGTTTLCQGASYDFPYTSSETYNAGNVFLLQMSDQSGSFANPTTIGQLAGTSTTGTIEGTIPFVPLGSGYRFQVISTDPGIPSGCPDATIYTVEGVDITQQPADDLECLDQEVTFTALANGTGLSYQWERLELPPFAVKPSGLGNTATNDVARNGTYLFVAGSDGLYRSADNGNTFSKIATTADGLPNDNITALAVRGSRVLAATGNGLGISTDNGATFTTRNTSHGLGSNSINGVFIDAANQYYLATSGGLSISTNGGASFANYTNGDGLGSTFINNVLAIGSGSARTIYAATSSGISIARSGTTSFSNTLSGLGSSNVNAVAVSPSGAIYAATNGGVGVSYDGGLTFTNIINGLGDANVQDVFVDGALIFAATQGGLSVSSFGATSFSNYDANFGLPIDNVSAVLTSTSGSVTTIFLTTGGGFASTTLTITDMGGQTSNVLNFTLSESDANDRYRLRIANSNSCERYTRIARTAYVPPTIDYMVEQDLTKCGIATGIVQITGLLPNTEYTFVRSGTLVGSPADGEMARSDGSGVIRLSSLGPGEYMVAVSSLVPPQCTSNVVSFQLNEPPSPATPVGTAGPVCSGNNVVINLTSSLGPNQAYQWFTDMDATSAADPSSTTSNTYSPNTVPSSSGSFFVRSFDGGTNCVSDTVEIPFTLSSAPLISATGNNPTADNTATGSITISGLAPSTGYTVEYRSGNGPIMSGPYTSTAGGIITIPNLVAGVYNGIRAISDCPSNSVNSIVLLDPSDQGVDEEDVSPFRNTVVAKAGGIGGYFQENSNEASCTGSDNHVSNPASGIAVGIIRDPAQPTPQNAPTDVELNGYIMFDLTSLVPKHAVIEKVEYRAQAVDTYGDMVCQVPLTSASGDIQFDVTQVYDENYGTYLGFDPVAFDDIGNEKYNDFVIAATETGNWTDLGMQGVIDAQRRVDIDGQFQVGLSLSFGDFATSVYQFHGMVFAPADMHELRITYYQLDFW